MKKREIGIDRDAKSTSKELPAFLSKPEGASAYAGFPLVEKTETEGWIYGAITNFLIEGQCDSGDGFVQAPDGSRAGLVWEVGDFKTEVICPADKNRWGVYSIAFPISINTVEDMVFCFKAILPGLKNIYNGINEINKGK